VVFHLDLLSLTPAVQLCVYGLVKPGENVPHRLSNNSKVVAPVAPVAAELPAIFETPEKTVTYDTSSHSGRGLHPLDREKPAAGHGQQP
jgi:hypothetical protein